MFSKLLIGGAAFSCALATEIFEVINVSEELPDLLEVSDDLSLNLEIPETTFVEQNLGLGIAIPNINDLTSK